MYTRIALGKNSKMDVVAGESCGTSGQLLMLLPLFFALQLGQVIMIIIIVIIIIVIIIIIIITIITIIDMLMPVQQIVLHI
jgi:hypothetical protein